MAKVSKALLARLKKRKEGMKFASKVVNMKNFTSGRYRILPRINEEPGYLRVNLYSNVSKMGATSPETFDMACPVVDAYRLQMDAATDKNERKAIETACSVRNEYWFWVIDRADPGTPERPKILAFPGRKTIYEEIINRMTDEMIGDDVTHPLEGRDCIIKKEGSGKDNTKWSIIWADPTPLMPDKADTESVMAVVNGMDIRECIWKVDLDSLMSIYTDLTDREFPITYDGFDPDSKWVKDSEASAEDDSEKRTTKKSTVSDTDDPDEVEDEDTWIGKSVTFPGENEGEIVEGTVVGVDVADSTCYDVEAADGLWSVEADKLVLAETEEPATEEAEDEPEEEPPPASKKKTAKKSPRKPSVTKKKVTTTRKTKAAGKISSRRRR